jgi:hypothetical protein
MGDNQLDGTVTDIAPTDELRALAAAVARLVPDRRDPDAFHVLKDHIAARLRALAATAERRPAPADPR